MAMSNTAVRVSTALVAIPLLGVLLYFLYLRLESFAPFWAMAFILVAVLEHMEVQVAGLFRRCIDDEQVSSGLHLPDVIFGCFPVCLVSPAQTQRKEDSQNKDHQLDVQN